jgi:hypothetical protein
VKLALAAIPGGTAEIIHQYQHAQRWLGGEDVLTPNVVNPGSFLVGHYVFAVLAFKASSATATPFHFWIRAPAVLADLALALMLRALPRGGDRAAMLYMLSPVSLLLSVYHGQLHTVATAFAFCALWLAERTRFAAAGAVLALAVGVRQHFAVLAAPLVRRAGRRVFVFLGALGVMLVALNWPLLANPHLYRAVSPPAGYGTWGYSIVLVNGPRIVALAGGPDMRSAIPAISAALPAISTALYLAWAAAMAVRAWRRDEDPWHAALLFLVGFYAITPGWGVQWLSWALPFWIVVSRHGAIVYSALAGALLAISYWVWTFNAKYGIYQVTANLGALSRVDLALYMLAGALGVVTWLYCVKTAWSLWRE